MFSSSSIVCFYPVEHKLTCITKQLSFFLGLIDEITFQKLPDLLTINITGCQIKPLYFEAFSKLDDLESLRFIDSRIYVEKSPFKLQPNLLTHFRVLSFYNSFVADLNRNSFYELRFLRKLVFENSEVCNISSNALYDLKRITHLSIISTEILDFDFSQILKLKSLRYLALYDVRTNYKIDYNLFKYLPNLETVLFDPWVYRDLDFDVFPRLNRCLIGVRKVDNSEIREYEALLAAVVKKLDALKKKRAIEYAVVDRGQRINW